MKKCNICNKEYKNKYPHYCDKCGHNLTDQIEKTDIILFISKLFKVLGLFGLIIFTIPLTSCAIHPVCFNAGCIGEDISSRGWILMITPVILMIIGFIIKSIFKKICLKRINNR